MEVLTSKNPDYSWQDRAIRKWLRSGKQGMIEAVTGSGKSHVGMEALAQLYAEDKTLSTLIIVPTVPLLEQWYEKLNERFPEEKIGRIGGGYRDIFKIPPLAYVMTVHSALNQVKCLFSHCWDHTLGRKYKSFLIADECHHYIDAPVWSQIVKSPFNWDYTMGLSATIEPFEAHGLGQIVATYSFKDAYRDGLIPAFDLINMGVPLTSQEKSRYLDLTDEISELFKKVLEVYSNELLGLSDHWLFKRLQQLMGKIGEGREPLIERLFLKLFKRAEIYYMAQHKITLAESTVRELITQKKKIFVFFERIAAADYVNDNISLRAGKALVDKIKDTPNLWCKTYHSQMDKNQRRQVLEEFWCRESGALIVCRSLDEGIDVPDADGAILAASTKSARQRIQRIGRVLRRGDGNKKPIIITLFARGTGDEGVTSEDHREFEGVASIHEPLEQISYLNMIKDMHAFSDQKERTPKIDDRWLLFGEVDTGEEEYLLRMISKHINQGELIRLEFSNGKSVEGKYRFHTCHTINFYGHHAPTDNLMRVHRERR